MSTKKYPESMQSMIEIFGEPIHVVTRQQLIDDGILVPLSGHYYPADGDDWIPGTCKEVGFKIPIAMTCEAFTQYVMPIEGEGWKLAPGQDAHGRLFDVLNMLRYAISQNKDTSLLLFKVHVVPNVREDATSKEVQKMLASGALAPQEITLKSIISGDDDGSPCLTILLENQD